jgi:Mg2+ and Co2+ transporter CorA
MKFGFGMNVKTPLFQVGWEYLVVLILLSCINIGFANLSWQRSYMLRHLSFD